MKRSTRKSKLIGATLGTAAALCLIPGRTQAEDFSSPSVNAYWGESWTDATGTYNSPASNTSVAGNQLIAPIPTDANSAYPDYDVVNYVRTYGDALPGAATYYNGTLLGDLSSANGLTATFSVNNSNVPANSQFAASQFVGEGTTASGNNYTFGDDIGTGINSGTPSPSVRLVFTGGGADGEWWSTSGVSITSLTNGQAVTTSADFDPSAWSDVNGQLASSSPLFTADFDTALSSVSRLGLSFGSGFFYSDGWGFNTGGTASLNVDSINTTVPEPASLSLLGVGALALLRRRRKSTDAMTVTNNAH